MSVHGAVLILVNAAMAGGAAVLCAPEGGAGDPDLLDGPLQSARRAARRRPVTDRAGR
jgi:hypothetical protein